MANVYTGTYGELPNIITWVLSDNYYVDETEAYRTQPLAGGSIRYDNPYAGTAESTVTGVTIAPNQRNAGYIMTGAIGSYIQLGNDVNYCVITLTGNAMYDSTQFPQPAYVTYTNGQGELYTNIPVFNTLEQANAYVRAQTDAQAIEILKLALNYKPNPEFSFETNYYYIYNEVGEGEQVRNTVTPTGSTSWRSLKFSANSIPVMYYMSDSYELVLKANDVVASYYLAAPGSVLDMVPESEWHTGLVAHGVNYGTLPNRLEATGENLPDGVYDYGFTLYTNIYIFSDYQSAQDAIDSGDYSGASNYSNVSQGNSYIPPAFGSEEQATTFGEGADTSPFTASYVLTRNECIGIALKFYDDTAGVVDSILDGLREFGAKPVDAIAGLTLYPFDINEIVTTMSQPHIYWGTYKMTLGFDVDKVLSLVNSAYLDCGSIFLRPLFYSYLDFEPYTTLSVYLPFIGWQKVDIRPLIGKTVSIRYYVDIHTRSCVAVILANDIMITYYTGTIGVCLPVSATDFQAYANAAMGSILQTAGGVISGAGTALGAAGTIAAGGLGAVAGAGIAAGGIAAAGISLAGGLFDMEKMGKPKDHQVTKGNYTSGTGCYMPQYIIWRYDIHEAIEPDGLANIYGKPSSSSGQVGQFSGFLKVRSAKLNTNGMTDSEANEIASLLKSGIYI